MEKEIESVEAEGLEKELKEKELDLPLEIDEGEKKEKTPEELEKHKESSKLGRKYGFLERQVGALTETVENFISSQRVSVDTDEIDMEIPITHRDLSDALDKRDKAKEAAEANYSREYMLELGRLTKDMTDEEADVVLSVLEKDYNSRSHKDPRIAAGFNFRDAQIAYLTKAPNKRTMPLNEKGNRTQLPAGISGGEREKVVGKELPDLDESAKGFLAKCKMSAEDIKSALEEDSNTLKWGK